MKNIKIYSFILFLFLLQIGIATAQENNVIRVFVSEKVETINGKKFYLHTVEKGQTLYSIAVAYNKPLSAIAKENNIENNVIGVGQVLRIPVEVDATEIAVPEKVVSKENIYHKVKKGETLFGISKKYKVSVADLEKMNPVLKDGLKIGQSIIVGQKAKKQQVEEPAVTQKSKKQQVEEPTVTEFKPDSSDQYFIHIVQKKETLFSISNQYVVPVKDIIALNPWAEKGIKPKQNLKIPSGVKFDYEEPKKKNEKEVIVKAKKDTVLQIIKNINCSPINQKRTLQVALLIPLYLDDVGEINTDFSSHTYQSSKKNIKAFTYIQYYQGFMLALDSLKKTGLSVSLHVFDITNDVQMARNFIGKPDMKKLDVIVGPFFIEPFNIVAHFAKENNIKIINPLITETKTLPSNANLINVAMSADQQLEGYVNYLYKKHADKNIILVHNNTANEINILKMFKSHWSSVVGADTSKYSYSEVIYNQSGLTSIINNIKNNKTNFILCFSNSEAFISNFIRKISEIQDGDKIALFGLPSWQMFNNIELSYLQTLNYHYFSTDYINYSDSITKNFILKFRESYAIEPNNFAYSGYDAALFFLNAINKYGQNFTQCINNIEYHPVSYGYNFRYNNSTKSFDNTRLAFLKYVNFAIQEDN